MTYLWDGILLESVSHIRKWEDTRAFFCKSAMPVVQSLRAQKGIKNLSEKKYEKTYRIRYGSGYDSIFMRSDSVEGK